jgi:hypothetical protein
VEKKAAEKLGWGRKNKIIKKRKKRVALKAPKG